MKSTLTEADSLVLQLVFPAEWRQPKNPLAEPAGAWARTFLADFGFLNHPGNEDLLENLDVAGYGWPFYAADRGVLCTTTAFLALWTVYHHRLAGRGESDEAALITAVRGEGTRPPNPYHAAFWELGQRYCKKLGRTFLARHGERFRAWLRGLEAETAMAEAFRRGEPVSLSAYLELRRVQIGMLPTLDFLELDLGEELAPAFWNDPRMSTLERLSSEVVALQHDLRRAVQGALEGAANGAPDALRLLQREEGLSASAALARLVRLHNDKVQELDRVGRATVRDQKVAALTAWWIRLGGMIAGFGRWHAEGARGSGPRSLGGRQIQLCLEDPEDDDTAEAAITTAVWKLPQLLALAAAPAAG